MISEFPEFEGDDTLPGNIDGLDTSENPASFELEGWETLEHEIPYGNGKTSLRCVWTGSEFLLSVQLFLHNKEIEREDHIVSHSPEDIHFVQRLFSVVSKNPVDIPSKIKEMKKKPSEPAEDSVQATRFSFRGFISRLFSR